MLSNELDDHSIKRREESKMTSVFFGCIAGKGTKRGPFKEINSFREIAMSMRIVMYSWYIQFEVLTKKLEEVFGSQNKKTPLGTYKLFYEFGVLVFCLFRCHI